MKATVNQANDIPVIEVQEAPPNAMCADLGNKLGADLRALLQRSLHLMLDEIGPDDTISIILSNLAAAGVSIERASNARPRSFMAIVAQTETLSDRAEDRSRL